MRPLKACSQGLSQTTADPDVKTGTVIAAVTNRKVEMYVYRHREAKAGGGLP